MPSSTLVAGFPPREDRLKFLLCGLTERLWRKRLYLMLRTFIDESGDNNGLFVVAGYAAFCSSWGPITNEWNKVLDQTPLLDYYRTHDLLSPLWRKEHGWTEHQAQTKIRKLANVIDTHKVDLQFAVYATISQSEFNSAIGKFPRQLKKELQYPYQYLFLAVLAESLRKLHRDGIFGDVMDFVLDRNDAVTDTSERIVKDIRNLIQDRTVTASLGDAIPQNDKDFAALQMADMFAARVRNYRTTENNINRSALHTMQPDPEKHKVIAIRFTGPTLVSFLDDFFVRDPVC
jgi:hypothetical protein